MLNDRSTPTAFLATRRSGKPRDLGLPGPSPAQIDAMIAIAARTPDHGKIAPWRFVVVEDRDRLSTLLTDAHRAEGAPGDPAALDQFARQAPALVVVMSSPRRDHPVPVWEQELSAGAVCMNLLHAANALGFAGGWLTGWPSYSPAVRAAFGGAGERIAGFVFIGTPTRALDERPRPEMTQIVTRWSLD